MMEAVRPAAEEPFPEVYIATGAVFSTNLRNFNMTKNVRNMDVRHLYVIKSCITQTRPEQY